MLKDTGSDSKPSLENMAFRSLGRPATHEGQIFLIELPSPPDRGNRRGQTRYEAFAKNRYYASCDAEYPVFVPDYKTKFPLQRALFEAEVEVFNPHDCDNLMALFKWPIDWLKTRGVIAGDDRHHLWPRRFPTQVVKRKGQNKIRIWLYEC